MTRYELAQMIDHTALKPDTTPERIRRLCAEALEFGFGAVCVAPVWVPMVANALAGSPIKVATVIGFPHGNTLSSVKGYEATETVKAGAEELDMVVNVGALKSDQADALYRDISTVVEAAKSAGGAVVKVILETALLSDAEKVLGAQIAEKAGADYVKTSTGFASGGATVEDVALLRRTVGDRLGVKASGGIRTLRTALAMIEAGATRLGASSSVAIMQEFGPEGE